MSTTMSDACGPSHGPHELHANDNNVCITTVRNGAVVAVSISANVTRADFIAAVEAECDGIFIPRASLPGLRFVAPGHYQIDSGDGWHLDPDIDAETAYQGALEHLALAEYLKAHPPVDEAIVKTLADLVGEQPSEADTIRALLATGRVQVTP